MNRRIFLAGASSTVLAPRAAAAQPPGKVHRIAILSLTVPVGEITETGNPFFKAFFEELRRLGYVEGRNLAVERRSAERDAQRLPALARELAALKPDVIVSGNNRTTASLKAATATIPIVAIVTDPIGSGFALSMARPGGNITGFSSDAGLAIVGKRIELLKEAVPAASRTAWLGSRTFWESRFEGLFREAARLAGVAAVGALLDSPFEEAGYRRAFAAMVQDRADSLVVALSPENFVHRRLIADLAVETRLPAIYGIREFAEAGGLMAYGTDGIEINRRTAGYVERILKGANPAELPIQQPTKFVLTINLKTAKALGLAIPSTLLTLADEIIE